MRTCPSILLVGPRLSESHGLREELQERGCACLAVTTLDGATRRIQEERFDVVLSETGLGLSSLTGELARAGSSLFFCIPVRVGWHWTPFLRSGKTCFGEPLLGPTGLLRFLDTLAKSAPGKAPTGETGSLPGEWKRRPGATQAILRKGKKPA